MLGDLALDPNSHTFVANASRKVRRAFVLKLGILAPSLDLQFVRHAFGLDEAEKRLRSFTAPLTDLDTGHTVAVDAFVQFVAEIYFARTSSIPEGSCYGHR